MSDNPERYQHGYSIGVGAVVLAENKVLLVQVGYGSYVRQWAFPGGYVEPGETVNNAVTREVLEETGISAEVHGLIAARSRVYPEENSAYLIFLLLATTPTARADGSEVIAARFFSLDELRELADVTPMTRLLATRALEGNLSVLRLTPVPSYPASEFVLFV